MFCILGSVILTNLYVYKNISLYPTNMNNNCKQTKTNVKVIKENDCR